MSTNDSTPFDYDNMFTDDVLRRARQYATSFARATRGAWSEDELVQRACVKMWTWAMSSHPTFVDVGAVLREYVKAEYVRWLRGHNPSRPDLTRTTERDKHFSATSIDDVSEGANPPQLTIGNPVDGWGLERDVKRALATLTPAEQEQVYQLYWRGELLHEVGARTGVTKQRAYQRLQAIVEKLRPLLADYAPPERDEKRSHETRSPSR